MPWTVSTIIYSFGNDLPEVGLQGQKHVGAASQNSIYGYMCNKLA